FVVTWDDVSQGVGGATGDSDSFAAKGQVFTAGGAPVGSEILVNTATVGEQDTSQITALSNGGFVVTWQDYSAGVGGATGDPDSAAVKAQVFGAGGAPVGSEILVNTATAGWQGSGQITALAGGGFVVTWTDESHGVGGATGDTSNYAVKAQVFAAGGTPVGSEILVNTATAQEQQNSYIAGLSGGGFVVAWIDRGQGVGGAAGDPDIYAFKAQVFGADGTPVGSEVLVNTATASDQFASGVTALSNGGFVVTWEDESQGVGGATGDADSTAIKAQAFTALGARVGSEVLVNTATANNQYGPHATALADDGIVVTWVDNSHGVGGATGDASGAALKAQVFSITGAASPPAAAPAAAAPLPPPTSGGPGIDLAILDNGDNTYSGQGGDDVICGEGGNDTLQGNTGDDLILGGAGNDLLHGGKGDDRLEGGPGDDWLSGDLGNDTLRGGPGADTFQMVAGGGTDRVVDFDAYGTQAYGGDRVYLPPGTAYTAGQVGADTVIEQAERDQMVLVGVQFSSLPAGWIFS
ncbi:MAG: calcium-binding protein, partial [Phenylobacterium sp.]